MLLFNSFTKMQEYSISQFRSNPDYLLICRCIAGQFDNLQKTSEYLLNMCDIEKAEGKWLDYIGWLVGTSRTYFDISKFFSVNSPDLNEPKYFWFTDQTISGESSLNDILFRRRIYAKIGYNTTKGARKENIFIIKNMTFADKVIIQKPKAMVLDITLEGKNIIKIDHLRDEIENILAPGVGLGDFKIVPYLSESAPIASSSSTKRKVSNGQTNKTKRTAA